MTSSNPDPNRRSEGSMPDDAGNGTTKQKIKEDARESLVQFYRDQPLIAGCFGIAIGAAPGALVPPTGMEDDMFGEASDRSVNSAKSKAVEKYDEVRESVRSE